MPENIHPTSPQQQDDELARFADQVLNGEQPEVPVMEKTESEVAELMSTVVRLDRAFKAEQPDAAMANRIRANLLREWEMNGPAAERGSFWQRLWPGREAWSSAQQRQMFGLALTVVAVAVLVAAFFLITSGSDTGPITGSGGGLGQLPSLHPALIVGGLAVLALAVWWFSRPRK